MSKPQTPPFSTMIVGAAALIDRDGRVLLARRPEHKPMGGLWEFPGGKIESKETPEDGLVRELNEELGINTEKSCLAPLGFSSTNLETIHLLLLLFVCRKWVGNAYPLEGQTLKWVKVKDIMDYKMPQADRPLAAQLRGLLCSSH